MRVLRIARSSARSGRTKAINQMHSIVVTAPDELREELRDLSIYRLLERCAMFRPAERKDVVSLTKRTLRMLAQRALALEEEVKEIDRILKPLLKETAPELLAVTGTDVGTAIMVLLATTPNA